MEPLDFTPLPFLTMFAASAVFIAVAFWLKYRRMQAEGPTFPDLSGVTVRFRERGASGRSLRDIFTRIGGGSNVMEVVVTESELWIRAPLPFSIVAHGFDGLHRVPLRDVALVKQAKRWVTVEFPRSDGRRIGFELRLRDPSKFAQALAT